MKPVKFSGSILSANFAHLEEDIRHAESGGVDYIHIDVIDGHFAPNITMGPFVVETCRRITSLPLDVHLMIERPELIVQQFIDAGATYISIHPENNQNVMRTIDYIRSQGVHPSVAINPGTPVSALDAVLPFVDMAMILSVNPGFSGQKFMPQAVERITELADLAKRKNCDIDIEVDGGINTENIQICRQAGASVFVAATSIFKYPQGIEAGIQTMRTAAG